MHKVFVVAMALATATLIYPKSPSTPGDTGHNFLKQASEINLAEIDLGRLAQKNASSSVVKQFGERMIADHTRLEDQAKTVASKTGVALPSHLNIDDRAEYNRLAGESGAAFDKAYIALMVKGHKQAIAEFQTEADSSANPAIKSFAVESLPTLKEHLRLAESAAKKVGVPTAVTSD